MNEIEIKFSFNVKEMLDADIEVEDQDNVNEYPSEGIARILNKLLDGVKLLSYGRLHMQVCPSETNDDIICLDTTSCHNIETKERSLLICREGVEIIAERGEEVTFSRRGDYAYLEITRLMDFKSEN